MHDLLAKVKKERKKRKKMGQHRNVKASRWKREQEGVKACESTKRCEDIQKTKQEVRRDTTGEQYQNKTSDKLREPETPVEVREL